MSETVHVTRHTANAYLILDAKHGLLCEHCAKNYTTKSIVKCAKSDFDMGEAFYCDYCHHGFVVDQT